MSAFIPHFDAIGVEASFEEVPKLRQYALPLMKDRPQDKVLAYVCEHYTCSAPTAEPEALSKLLTSG